MTEKPSAVCQERCCVVGPHDQHAFVRDLDAHIASALSDTRRKALEEAARIADQWDAGEDAAREIRHLLKGLKSERQ